eukprot:2506231-Amphidinium_carterae.1
MDMRRRIWCRQCEGEHLLHPEASSLEQKHVLAVLQHSVLPPFRRECLWPQLSKLHLSVVFKACDLHVHKVAIPLSVPFQPFSDDQEIFWPEVPWMPGAQ